MYFSVVIPTYNRALLLLNLLDSLSKMHIPGNAEFEIRVVDNHSTDDTRDVVDSILKMKSLPLIYSFEKEQGASFARNRGIKESRGDIVAFLDDDETVDESWLAALCEGFERFQCAGIGGKVVAKWTFTPPDWYTTEGPFRIAGPTAGHDLGDQIKEYSVDSIVPPTANLAVKKECFQKFGYFRTDMGPIGNTYSVGEDTEFCIRLLKGGERLIYCPQAITYNKVHQERVTKEYCKRYHFQFGRTRASLHEAKEGERLYFNVPRYLFRMYGEAVLNWLRAIVRRKKQAIFYYRLSLGRIGGQIVQHVLENPSGPLRKLVQFLVNPRAD